MSAQDYIAGSAAFRNNEPMDTTQSDCWQAGWHDASIDHLIP